MDAVGEAARAGISTADYLSENLGSLGAFALSFVLIARFWRAHHQLFAAVEHEPRGLFWLNMAWLFAVVFLRWPPPPPVPCPPMRRSCVSTRAR